jgi:glycerol kinase
MSHRKDFILVLDAGTTTVRAIAFRPDLTAIGRFEARLAKTFPRRGWVEQDPRQMIRLARRVLRRVVGDNGLQPRDCLGIGITNQRETAVLWDERTGRPAYPAIVWEDLRTSSWCRRLKRTHGREVRALTGLSVDPYFSATKITWVLAHVPAARHLLEAGRLRFGTVDSWLLWNLAVGRPHVTDETNAGRTLLLGAKTRGWDRRLLEIFGVPASILPRVLPSRSEFGRLGRSVLGREIPFLAVCGDQQSSLYAAWGHVGGRHATKITYGTGTFVDQVIGRRFVIRDPFFTTIVPDRSGGSAYALEAKIAKGGREVEPLLGDDRRLRRFLKRLATEADGYLQALPHRPKTVAVDGGVSRDGIVGAYQAQISGVTIRPLPIFDGTALGTARLVIERAKSRLSP